MDFNNLFMEQGGKSSMRMGAFMKANSKMKIKMVMVDKYSKMENTMSVSLRMIREKDQVPLFSKVAVYNKVIGKTINFQDDKYLINR